MVRSRFAPSPTGLLHAGSAWAALASWAFAKQRGGTWILRVEDIDTPRIRAGSLESILDDLRFLGLAWDEGPGVGGIYAPYTQSERTALYEDALRELTRLGLVYPCDCSRKEIQAASEASAPHGAETRYPGTCRDKSPQRSFRRLPALRLRVPRDASVSFVDGVFGAQTENVSEAASDFVLQRGDGLFAYQLVVAIDDRAMRITDVVRGADLLPSTARQILLMQLLGATEVPQYTHVALVVGEAGERLAKREQLATMASLRERGWSAERLLGVLGHGLGLVESDAPCTLDEIAARAPTPMRGETWVLPPAMV